MNLVENVSRRLKQVYINECAIICANYTRAVLSYMILNPIQPLTTPPPAQLLAASVSVDQSESLEQKHLLCTREVRHEGKGSCAVRPTFPGVLPASTTYSTHTIVLLLLCHEYTVYRRHICAS